VYCKRRVSERQAMKVLYITPVPYEGAGARFRIYQYLPYLSGEGVRYSVSPFLFSSFFKIVYKKGNTITKILFFVLSFLRRLFDLIRALKYDVVVIYRESFPYGPPIFEWFIKKMGKPIIYDIDDAIYLPNPNIKESVILRYLKCYSKVKDIIKLSSYVIVCNSYLKDYAEKLNPNVAIIPTPIDTDKFTPRNNALLLNNKVVIGWIGTHTTFPYLERLSNVFIRLTQKHNFVLKVVGASREWNIPGVEIINQEWTLENDIGNFQSLDIGIYPLGGSEFDLGKAGFKTLQYMSVGIPAVVSNVGMNKEIIQDGINGFLTVSEEEWIEKLSRLITDQRLRKEMGMRGRYAVEQAYSVKENAPKLLQIFRNIYKKN
jgi:glycosyltransferase involved in cell wall biosynthesis